MITKCDTDKAKWWAGGGGRQMGAAMALFVLPKHFSDRRGSLTEEIRNINHYPRRQSEMFWPEKMPPLSPVVARLLDVIHPCRSNGRVGYIWRMTEIVRKKSRLVGEGEGKVAFRLVED